MAECLHKISSALALLNSVNVPGNPPGRLMRRRDGVGIWLKANEQLNNIVSSVLPGYLLTSDVQIKKIKYKRSYVYRNSVITDYIYSNK